MQSAMRRTKTLVNLPQIGDFSFLNVVKGALNRLNLQDAVRNRFSFNYR